VYEVIGVAGFAGPVPTDHQWLRATGSVSQKLVAWL